MRVASLVAITLISAGLTLGACAHRSSTRFNRAASPADQAGLIERVKSLQGEWMMADEKGAMQLAAVFKVSSNGSIVHETMFPGSAQEMTNVYHMDGDSLVMTHYCAMGNQPRLRAHLNDGHNHASNQIHFKSDSVTNLRSADERYMGDMLLTFKDARTIEQVWRSYQHGKLDMEHDTTISLTRR